MAGNEANEMGPLLNSQAPEEINNVCNSLHVAVLNRIIPSHVLIASPGLMCYSAELPLSAGFIRDV